MLRDLLRLFDDFQDLVLVLFDVVPIDILVVIEVTDGGHWSDGRTSHLLRCQQRIRTERVELVQPPGQLLQLTSLLSDGGGRADVLVGEVLQGLEDLG